MGDDITIGVTEIVNNIEVTAQPNDQIVDISVIDNADEVTLNITPTVIEINVNKGSSYARWGTIYGNITDQTDLQNALLLKADLVDGKVPAYQLPSFVDDIIEVANYAALPATGETGKIYVTLDNNKIYRWSGSIYIEIASNNAIWGSITGTLSNQTDLQNALNLRVPYTGATSNVNLGEYGLTSGFLGLDTTPTSTPTGIGTIYWDAANRTAALIDGDGDTTLQIGQEERILVHNNTGATLTDGQVVYITGSTGNLPSVSLANASSETTSAATLGVVTESIANGADGFVTVSGIVNGLNTLAFNEGDLLWLGTTAGTFTTTKPISPNHLVLIGYVIKKAGGNGSILVKIQNTQELEESSDVLFTSLANNQVLTYESATDLWKNKSIATILGYTPANDASVVKLTGDQSITGSKSFTTNTAAPAMVVTNNLTDNGILLQNTSTGRGITSNNVSTGTGISSSNTGSGTGFYSNNSSTGNGIESINSSSGYGINSSNTGSGRGIYSSNNSTGDAINIANSGSGRGIYLTNASTGNSLILNNGTAATGMPFTVSKNSVDKFTINDAGEATGVKFIKSGGTSSQFLKADGSVDSTTYQTALTNPVTGTGTTNYIPKFTGASALGNSLIYDNGTNVGIGTASPAEKLDVSGNLRLSDTAPYLTLKPSGWSGSAYIQAGINLAQSAAGDYFSFQNLAGKGFAFQRGTTTDMLINSNGELLIGRTSSYGAGWLVNVEGNIYAKNDLRIDGGGSFGGSVGIGTTTSPATLLQLNSATGVNTTLSFSENGTLKWYNRHNAGDGSYQIVDVTNSATRLHITSGGNIGIGETNPAYKLDVKSSGYNVANFNSTFGQVAISFANSGNIFAQMGSGTSVTPSAAFDDLGFGTAGLNKNIVFATGSSYSERMRITSGGQVQISSPISDALKLTNTNSAAYNGIIVQNDASNQVVLGMGGSTVGGTNQNRGYSGTVSNIDYYLMTNNSPRLHITSGGDVLVGNTAAVNSEKLGVTYDSQARLGFVLNDTYTGAATAQIAIQFRRNGSAIGSVTTTTTTTAYNITSDYRLKQDFKPFNGLDLVSKIKVYDYEWKSDNSRMNGVIAHELQEVVPYAVTGEKDAKEMQGVDYSKLVPILVQAIQELQEKINKLENK